MAGQDEDNGGVVRRLVKSKSGLKIVCQHDRETAPWDMAEPAWVPDNQVIISTIFSLNFYILLELGLIFLLLYASRNSTLHQKFYIVLYIHTYSI